MSETKPTNPKDALGIKKAPLSTLPTQVGFEVALAMLEGARKYGRHNYRSMGVKASVYYDACQRHLAAWWEGEDIDPDSGLSHIAKAAACLFVLRDSMLMENWEDDRPPQHPNRLNLTKLNELAEEIIEKYPDCVEPHTEKSPVRTETQTVNGWTIKKSGVTGCELWVAKGYGQYLLNDGTVGYGQYLLNDGTVYKYCSTDKAFRSREAAIEAAREYKGPEYEVGCDMAAPINMCEDCREYLPNGRTCRAGVFMLGDKQEAGNCLHFRRDEDANPQD
jgi:hypothetical protein